MCKAVCFIIDSIESNLKVFVSMLFLVCVPLMCSTINGVYCQNVRFISDLTIALSSSHSNELWQTQDAWFCLLCSVMADYPPPLYPLPGSHCISCTPLYYCLYSALQQVIYLNIFDLMVNYYLRLLN